MEWFAVLGVVLAVGVSAQAAEKIDLSKVSVNALTLSKSSQASALVSVLGLEEGSSLTLLREIHDADSSHYRYVQNFRGMPVWGEHILVKFSPEGKQLMGFHGTAIQGIAQDLGARTARLSDAQALVKAKSLLKVRGSRNVAFRDESSTLSVYLDDSGKAHMAYVVTFVAEAMGKNGRATAYRPTTIIDALTRKVLLRFDGLTTAEEVDGSTGPGGNLKTGKYLYGTDFGRLPTTQSGNTCTMSNEQVATIDLAGGTLGGTPFTFTCPENLNREINGAYSPLNDAFYFGNQIETLYRTWIGQAPLTFKLVLKVHYSSQYENAFWDGQSMQFGDGKTLFYPLVSLDVAGHEISHGFTEQNSGLVYRGQSGGMNEAFSDIAGEAAENLMRNHNDFQVGAEIFKQPNKALRYMDDPTKDGRSIGSARNYTSTLDVHYSSGVYNKAFYLLANRAGWNVKMAFTAFAKANQRYWTPTATFITGAQGVYKAAQDLGYPVADVVAAFAGVDVAATP